MAAYNAFINRLLNVPMTKEDYEEELNTIKCIAIANGYKTETIDKLINKKKKKIKNKTNIDTSTDKKFTSVNYENILPQILKNEFKKLNINISFKTNNNIQKLLKNKMATDIKSSSGVYKIKCDDCDKYYIGQTGRTFYDRYLEHKPKPNTRSTYALHLMEHNHKYTDFETNLTPLHICKKGKILDATEEFEIYKANRIEQDSLLNDKLTIKTNPLYDTAIKLQTR